ncbi:acyl-CoA thioesterase [Leeia sp. TBRC 13508]|uniref:Acyl-CoA thioesterase n=1 Tax=Leeia speluncae TaxID=2884804 RepID=A0ABS8D8S6_9NEIS|nr:acyl-CoA thioesterase [Leeia speluncae]MCB6184610.1 acyl-CoA thioesterase [Leeia speluncae]
MSMFVDTVELPPGKIPTLRVMTMPKDANAYGSIFGGWMMSQVDIAGAAEATNLAKGAVVTVAVNAFQFKEPVHVGDLVSFYAEPLRVGRTSVTIKVEVFAERHPENPIVVKVTEATLTYVAVDVQGKPRVIVKPE